MATSTTSDSRLLVDHYVREWGGAASNVLADNTCSLFTDPNIQGLIGYRVEGRCVIVFGDPVCSLENRPLLVQAFHQRFEAEGKNIVYATTSEEFSYWAMENVCKGLIEVGEELVLDPLNYPKQGSNGRLLRKKSNHAKRDGVTIKEYTIHDEHIEKGIELAGKTWLEARNGPQIFLAHVDLFSDRNSKRWFYALKDEKIVGVILLNRLEAHGGWLLNLLMATPEAPIGTSEFLVTHALDVLCDEGCHFLSFGTVPSQQLGEIRGLGAASVWIARTVFKSVVKFFQLDGRRKFWLKFEPVSRRNFILFTKPRIGFSEVWAIMRAFNANLYNG